MTERYPIVEAAVFNGLSGVLNDMGLHVPLSKRSAMAAWVTRQAFAELFQQKAFEAAMELRAALHRLWMGAGAPSSRKMAQDLGKSHMTWFTALRCDPVAPWSTFSKLVVYLDGDPGKLEDLWLRAKGKDGTS